MATTIENLRVDVQLELQDDIDNELFILWCNDAQSDFAMGINIPVSAQIAVTTTDLAYTLPADLRIINRLSLQSEIDDGHDWEIRGPYRIYNGKIIFQRYFCAADILNVDYYRNLKYYTAITDAIDIEDRFSTLYRYYCKMMYYGLPSVRETKGDTSNIILQLQSSFMSVKKQIIAQYSLRNEPTVIQGRW